MGLAEKVASRFVHAGGSDFSVYVPVADPKQAFREAIEDAQHESGHGGYSGTIAEKAGAGYVVRKHTPMTRAEAADFAYKDGGHNDKWGPAYAVPVAEAAEGYDKKWKVKVPARDERAAYEPAEKAARELFAFGPNQHATFKIEKVTRIKEGKLPEMTIEKGGAEGFRVRGGGSTFYADRSPTFASRAEAVVAIKKSIPFDKPPTGTKFTIEKFKTVNTFTIGDTTKSMHLFEVEGSVTVKTSTGKIVGWLFYGVASS